MYKRQELYGLFNAEESAVKMIDQYEAPIYTCEIEFGTDEEIMGKQQADLIGASHGVFIPFLSGVATGCLLYTSSYLYLQWDYSGTDRRGSPFRGSHI